MTAQAPDALETNTKSTFRDTAFMANRGTPVHGWVPWIAGFSSQFVQDALDKHMDSAGTVLDPFAGVGTTLVEADLAGHEAVGFEVNPYAAFAARTKLGAHSWDTGALVNALNDFVSFMEASETSPKDPETKPPEAFRTYEPFYSLDVLRKVLFMQDFIAGLEPSIKNVFRLAFASSMVSYSNYSYEPSLGRRSSAGKARIDDFPVAETVRKKVEQMTVDVDWYRQTRKGRKNRKDGRVLETSFLDTHGRLKPQSIDLLVTSPPYLNNYHYNRNTRPHLYWLGFCNNTEQVRRLENLNFGQYWQNARSMPKIALNPDIQDEEIHHTVELIRCRNADREAYGGSGWANYAVLYFNDALRFVIGAKKYLRSGATALVVIGNSILQSVNVPTDRFLASIAEGQGLKVEAIHLLRTARVGSSIVDSAVRVGKTDGKTPLYESVVELHRL